MRSVADAFKTAWQDAEAKLRAAGRTADIARLREKLSALGTVGGGDEIAGGLGLTGGGFVAWTKEEATKAGDALANLGKGATTVITEDLKRLPNMLVGISAAVADAIVGVWKVEVDLLQGKPLQAFSDLLQCGGKLGGDVIGITQIGPLLDAIGDLRGQWSGRSLNAEERDVLRNVFGNDVNFGAIKVVENAFCPQDRPYVNGTTIFLPGSGSIRQWKETFIHEMTHIVQKQKYHYDVTGRGVSQQVGNWSNEKTGKDERNDSATNDWHKGPPSRSGTYSYDSIYLSPNYPVLTGADSLGSLLWLKGAEAHATLVEDFYKFATTSATLGKDGKIDFSTSPGWAHIGELFRQEGWFKAWL